MTTTIPDIGMNIKQLEQHPNGLVYKFKKINGQFIHTYYKGKLIEKNGLPPSSVLNRTLYDIMPYEEAEQKHRLYERAWNGEIIYYEGCLNNIHYFAILLPIKEYGKTVEVWGVAFDVTWSRLLEKKHENTERFDLISQLAAGVAHEIRNPLTSLKGFTQILKEMITEYDKQHYLAIMQDELEKIQQIVNEFILLSKPQNGLNIKEMNIGELVADVIDLLRPEITLYNLPIIKDIPNDIVAEGDPGQIRQIIRNLLQNAIDASKERKKEIIVSVKYLNTYYYEIRIKDFGHGISKERQEKLFQPFYTTKEKGIGLGLMVCKRIVDLHQGNIKLNSCLNVGTEVIVELPRKLK